MSGESILWLLLIGLAAGWISSRIVRGHGGSLLGSLAVGVLGAFIGPLILDVVGVTAPADLLGQLVTAVIGAAVLLIVAQAIGSLVIVLVVALVIVILLGGLSISVNA